jgi:hypothetical protein
MSDEGDPKDVPPKPAAPEADEDALARVLVKKALGKKPAAPAPVAERDEPAEDGSPSDVELDEVDLKDALRGALRPPPGSVAPSLLQGVQRRLRVRSRGKFYGDGWSTSESPKTTYLITTLIMLLLLVILFLALVPLGPSTVP